MTWTPVRYECKPTKQATTLDNHDSRESRSLERLLGSWRSEICLQIFTYGAAKNDNNGNPIQETNLMEEPLRFFLDR